MVDLTDWTDIGEAAAAVQALVLLQDKRMDLITTCTTRTSIQRESQIDMQEGQT